MNRSNGRALLSAAAQRRFRRLLLLALLTLFPWPLSAQLPVDREIAALRQELERYQQIRAQGGWKPLPAGPALTAGEADDRIPLLRNRLALTGDLAEGLPGNSGPESDEGLRVALSRFQYRHGLDGTGIIGPETLAALNVTVDERIRQIRRNLDLRQELASADERRLVLVNIPEMKLRAFQDGKAVLTMRVIVGKPEQQTPVFSDLVFFLIFNPFWYIPPEIVEADILPGIRRNPEFLSARGIRLFRKMSADQEEISPQSIDWQTLEPDRLGFYFRQDPGWGNSLGKVKFVMHNREHIYLHDTPSRQLFEERDRALSFGCVRVEKPLDLAAFMLADSPDWPRQRLRELMESGQQLKIFLPQPIPVHLVYWTATIDHRGRLLFHPDMYDRQSRRS